MRRARMAWLPSGEKVWGYD